MVSPFYPPHAGGIEYHVENLSSELQEKGHRVAVLTSTVSEQELPSVTTSTNGIDIIKVKTYFPFKSIYPPIANQGFTINLHDLIIRLIKERQIEIVHVHGHHYYLTWRAIAAAKKCAIPCILTLHGLKALNRCNAMARVGEEAFNQTIFRNELRNLDGIIGLTPNITDYVKKYSVEPNCFTVPNGVNFKLYTNNVTKKIEFRRKYGIGLDKIVILFIGRFTQVKGIVELGEAARTVIKKDNRAFFIFVGGGQLSSTLTKILNTVKTNSKVISWTPQEKIHELILPQIYSFCRRNQRLFL